MQMRAVAPPRQPRSGTTWPRFGWAYAQLTVVDVIREATARSARLYRPMLGLRAFEEEIGRHVDVALHRGAQLQEGAMLELADALLRDAELAAQLLERCAFIAKTALRDDRALAAASSPRGPGAM